MVTIAGFVHTRMSAAQMMMNQAGATVYSKNRKESDQFIEYLMELASQASLGGSPFLKYEPWVGKVGDTTVQAFPMNMYDNRRYIDLVLRSRGFTVLWSHMSHKTMIILIWDNEGWEEYVRRGR
jgi:hypothetical protein